MKTREQNQRLGNRKCNSCTLWFFTFAIQGFNGIHTLEGRWKLYAGQEPVDYQLHCYKYESQFPKSDIRCELSGSVSRRFSLIYYDESTDSYIVNGENAGKPNVIFDTESGNKVLEWDPMGIGWKSDGFRWTKSGNTFWKIVFVDLSVIATIQ